MNGIFAGTADFDPGTGTEVLNSSSGNILSPATTKSATFARIQSSCNSVVGEIATPSRWTPSATATSWASRRARPTSTRAAANSCSRRKASPTCSWPAIRRARAALRDRHGEHQRDRGLDIAIDAAGSYVSGAFRGTVDFDPDVGTTTLTSAGNEIRSFQLRRHRGYRYAVGVGSTLPTSAGVSQSMRTATRS